MDFLPTWVTQAIAPDHGTAEPSAPAAHAEPESYLGDGGGSSESLLHTFGHLVEGVAQEGIGGLLDPTGMMDRQRAQEELATRFQVVGDDAQGSKRQNQVTEAEYEQIARTYSDVRLGRGDLTLRTDEMTDGGQQDRWRQGALDNLADMMQTRSGRAQVEHMSDNVAVDDDGVARKDADGNDVHRHTTLRALYKDANHDKNWANDPHSEEDYDNHNSNTTRPGAFDDDPIKGEVNDTERDEKTKQRGVGADAVIYWNPSADVGDCHRADVVLAHEMQHALHETQGTTAQGARDFAHGASESDPDYGTENRERQAVGLKFANHNANDPIGCPENTYRAERNELGDDFQMRKTYDGDMPG